MALITIRDRPIVTSLIKYEDCKSLSRDIDVVNKGAVGTSGYFVLLESTRLGFHLGLSIDTPTDPLLDAVTHIYIMGCENLTWLSLLRVPQVLWQPKEDEGIIRATPAGG